MQGLRPLHPQGSALLRLQVIEADGFTTADPVIGTVEGALRPRIQ